MISQCLPTVASGCTLCHVVPCCATPRPSNLFRSTADSVPQPLCGPMFYMNVSVFPLSLIAIFWGHPLNSQIQLFATYQCLSYFHVLIAPSEIPSGIPFQAYTVCVYVHIYIDIHTHAQEDIINSRYNVYIHTTPYYYIPFHFHSILFPFHSMSISLHYIIILHHYYDHNNDNHI